MHEDELWQVFDARGERVDFGRDAGLGNPERGETDYVGTAVVWIYRRSEVGIEVLFQRRSMKVDRNRGMWDVAAGGHINYGEGVAAAAVREGWEEIGVELEMEKLRMVAVISSYHANMFIHEYIYDYTGQVEDFHFDDEEVSEVRWVPIEEVDEFIEANAKKPLVEDVEVRKIVKEAILRHGNIG